MERIRRRWGKKAQESGAGPERQWQAPLATALQHGQLIYLCGSLFVGIAFQPFILMLIGLQCGLWSYLQRIESPARPRPGSLRKLNIPEVAAAT